MWLTLSILYVPPPPLPLYLIFLFAPRSSLLSAGEREEGVLLSRAARQFSLNAINQDGQISKGILSRSDRQPADSKGTWWQRL